MIHQVMPIFGKRRVAQGNQDFVLQVKTDNAGTSASNQFTIPVGVGAFNYTVTTSDGQVITGITGSITITFPVAGTYEIRIKQGSSFPYIFFNNGGDRLKLIGASFGFYNGTITQQTGAFWGCQNLLLNPDDSGNFGLVSNFISAFRDVDSSPVFPLINTAAGQTFSFCWNGSNFVTFPKLNFSSSISFQSAWANSLVANMPAGIFDGCPCINFASAFQNTRLTQQSINNVLVSINSNGTSGGTFFQSQGSAPSAAGQAAITAMRSRGWTVTVTGGF